MATAQQNVDTLAKYVATLSAVKAPTATQKAALATDQATLKRNQDTLAAFLAAPQFTTSGNLPAAPSITSPGSPQSPGAYGNTVGMTQNPLRVQGPDVNTGAGIDAWWKSQIPDLMSGAAQPGSAFGTTVKDAGPTANLTGPEFAATVIDRNTPVDFLKETKAWQKANLGSNQYAEQLFNRLNLLANAIKSGHSNPTLPAALTATQKEINRIEQISNGTGVGAADRNVPLESLLRTEGVYTTGNDAIQQYLRDAMK